MLKSNLHKKHNFTLEDTDVNNGVCVSYLHGEFIPISLFSELLSRHIGLPKCLENKDLLNIIFYK